MKNLEDFLNFNYVFSFHSSDSVLDFVKGMYKRIEEYGYITMNEALELKNKCDQTESREECVLSTDDLESFGWIDIPDFILKFSPKCIVMMDRPVIIIDKYKEIQKRKGQTDGKE